MAPKRSVAAAASAAVPAQPAASGTIDEVPEGWTFKREVKKSGKVVEYYGNVLGQQFDTMEELMQYVKYAKERGHSIYAPDFEASPSKASTSKGKKKKKKDAATKVSTKPKKGKEAATKEELECAKALLQISAQGVASRSSRRLAGDTPELTGGFFTKKPLEYVLKDKSPK